MNKPQAGEFDARQAELLTRQINTVLTTNSGYGPDHPMSVRANESLLEALHKVLETEAEVTLLYDRGALFFEKHPVGQRFNPRRLMNLLIQCGIESITFARNITLDEVLVLASILAEPENYSGLEEIRARLTEAGVRNIRLNYVVYRKLTADQQVVEADGNETDKPASSRSNTDGRQDPGDSIASLMSLDSLVRDPDGYASRVAEQDSDEGARHDMVRKLRDLVTQIETGAIGGDTALSSSELMSAVGSLRRKVRDNYRKHRDLETLLAEPDSVLGEIDQLTYSTLVSLVREEFRSGNFSPRRMAQIIRRMLPDQRDLKRLMPQLKQGLLGEGMSVGEYGKLVHELSGDLRDESVVDALESGAESVGLDVDEIVTQIREDPAEAARLIVMATELRHGGVDDQTQLSSAFTDYIERVSEKLALESLPGANQEAGETLPGQLARVQQLLIDQLGQQGMPAEVTRQLQNQLEQRRASPTDAEPEPEAPSSPALRLPGRILNPANSAFFLKREIKSAQRYGTPFSVIKISIESIRPHNQTRRPPSSEELRELLPEFYQLLLDQLRELDLIGSLDKERRAVPLMILPMTEQTGAGIVRWRLTDRLRDQYFSINDTPTQLITAITSVSFDASSGESGKAFIERLENQHQRNRSALDGEASKAAGSPAGTN